MDGFIINAYGKINLTLDVLRRRSDGYHEVRMIMQSISLKDVLTLTSIEEGTVLQTDYPYLDTGKDNLIQRAVEELRRVTGCKKGVKIFLKKNIPIAAGLAGGSSNAAAALIGLNDYWGLGLSRKELLDIGARIGSDVPFCMTGGTALAEGRGELITPLQGDLNFPVLLVKPNFSVSTREVYNRLRVQEIRKHPDTQGMIEAVKSGNLLQICSKLENVLEGVTINLHPLIGKIKKRLRDLGAAGVLMSGSGPTVFGLFPEGKKALQAQGVLKEGDWAVILTQLKSREEDEVD